MVKFMNAVILAAIVAAPALAQSTQEQSAELASREPEPFRGGFGGRGRFGGRRRFRSPSLSERDFDDINELDARELEELDARFWFLARKAVSKVAKKVGGRFLGSLMGRDLEDQDLSELSARELEDLEELAAREPFRGRGRFGGRRRFRSPSPSLSERDFDDMTELEARELEDLESRWFKIAARVGKKIGGHVLGSLFGRDLEDVDLSSLSARDIEELQDLDARWFKIAARVGKSVGKRLLGGLFGRELDSSDLESLSARDLEDYQDLEARWFKIAARVGKKIGGHVLGSLFGRDIEDLDELSARELEDLDELAAREPFRGRGRFGGRRRFRTPSPSLSERDFDESTDLEARRVRSSRLRKALRGSADLASSFVQREVSDIDELSAREYAEFEERCFGAAAKRLAQKDAELNQRNVEEALGELEARDFEGELEVEAREIDELD